MKAYILNTNTNKVIGRFDSIAAAADLNTVAKIPGFVFNTHPDSLRDLSFEQVIEAYKNLTGIPAADRRDYFVTRVDALRCLVKALAVYDFSAEVVLTSNGGVEDLKPAATLTPVRRTTRLGRCIGLLWEGATVEELAAKLNHPAKYIWRDHVLSRKGYGRTFRNGKFYLVLPPGYDAPLYSG